MIKKIACFFGLHSYEEPETDTFGIIMQLGKQSCQNCPKAKYWWSTFGASIPATKSKYLALLESMGKVSEVSKGTGAEAMTKRFSDKPDDVQAKTS
jgi:hypothetical protein